MSESNRADMNRLKRLGAAVILASLVAGCATTGNNPRDPLEPLNRAIYGFNDGLDQAIIKPVSQGYRAALPGIVRAGVTNFFSNIGDLWIAVNNLLQGKVEQGLGDVMRVGINTTFGLLGIIDVATDAGLDKHSEDFGQTLGRWGIGGGPYLVLPFFGPSSLRDGIGTVFDVAADPVMNVGHIPTRNSAWALRTTDVRAGLLDASTMLEEAALDKYVFARESYLQRRRSQIYDGNPPREEPLAGLADEPVDTRRARAPGEDLPPSLLETVRLPVLSASGEPVLAGAVGEALQTSY